MEELNIEKFSPKKTELVSLANKYKDLTIKGVKDDIGYESVSIAIKELVGARTELQKAGKTLRGEALSYQKAVIEKEKELLSIVEPVELDLKGKIKDMDLKIEREARKEDLPKRKKELKEIELEMSDNEILSMDDNSFKEFLNEKKTEYLDAKEAKIKEEEEEKRVKDRKEEDDKLDKKRKELDKKERKLNRIKAEEEAEKEAERKAKEKEEVLKKRKKYHNFLKRNGYTEEMKDQFKIINIDNVKFIIYKKLDEIIIK